MVIHAISRSEIVKHGDYLNYLIILVPVETLGWAVGSWDNAGKDHFQSQGFIGCRDKSDFI